MGPKTPNKTFRKSKYILENHRIQKETTRADPIRPEQYLSLKKNNVGAMAIDERTARREYSDYSKMDNISNNDAVNSNHYNRV